MIIGKKLIKFNEICLGEKFVKFQIEMNYLEKFQYNLQNFHV